MGQSIKEFTMQIFWKTVFKKFERIWLCLSRSYNLKFFKGCLPKNLISPS